MSEQGRRIKTGRVDGEMGTVRREMDRRQRELLSRVQSEPIIRVSTSPATKVSESSPQMNALDLLSPFSGWLEEKNAKSSFTQNHYLKICPDGILRKGFEQDVQQSYCARPPPLVCRQSFMATSAAPFLNPSTPKLHLKEDKAAHCVQALLIWHWHNRSIPNLSKYSDAWL